MENTHHQIYDISNTGRIAILMATYNGADFLQEQLDSLLNQTYQKFYCYIHDDGSSDGTKEIIDEYIRKYPDKFIYVEGSPVGGAKLNFLYLLSSVKADYYMFCDQDDIWMPEKIEKEKEALDKNHKKGKPVLVYCDLIVVDHMLAQLSESFYQYTGIKPSACDLRSLTETNCIVGCTMMFSGDNRDHILALRYSQHISMHDWLVALIFSINGIIKFVPEPLVLYRQHYRNELGANKKKTPILKLKQYLRIRVRYREVRFLVFRRRGVARELLTVTDNGRKKEFLLALSRIDEQPKWKRVLFYLRCHLFTGGSIVSLNKLFQALAI